MPKLFVNGDSHTAKVYGTAGPTASDILARELGCELENLALAGGSNQRIIRTTQERLHDLDPHQTVVMIGWTSFERTEWFFRGEWHAVCGDPYYDVDPALGDQWHAHVSTYHTDAAKRNLQNQEQHHAIYSFHQLLTCLGYQIIFYQACACHFFANCPHEHDPAWRLPWAADTWVHDPYASIEHGRVTADGFSHYSQRLGLQHTDDRAHYGADAHAAWAQRLLPILRTKLSKLT